jgi:heme/copper-type cytochrome/quinol oxidase subunit 4
MGKASVSISYAQSLVWVALFMALACGVMNIVELVFVDFIHGNPNRTQENAKEMMVLFTPLFSITGMIGAILVFTLPQFFQAELIRILDPLFGGRARFAVLAALPLTAVLTWYCYDYLTPTDLNLGINTGADWTPYQHGLSIPRYMRTLAVQAPVTLFSFLYFDASFRGRSRKPVLVAALAATIVIGAIWGYTMARDQFQFL